MRKYITAIALLCCFATTYAQPDTLRVMAYNVLYYGNGCQGPNGLFHGYMKTIAGYANADILSLEKMGSIPVSADDKYGTAPAGFADSVLQYALNAAYPGRYAHCPFTNAAKSNNMAVLFYDQHKLGFVAIVSSYTNITDFNTYKLYYKDPNLARTHDTTFLYLTPNHDKSGDENEQVRGGQITGWMQQVKAHFSRLPNYIDLGDFNVRNSDEKFYQIITAPEDNNFRFYDPPFYPDHAVKYPANWDHDVAFAKYFTTSTRQSGEIPNSCGTGGGAKNWYDHIFLSQWIVENTNYIRYIPNSYRTIGNDGKRYKVSVNNANISVNTSAPADVVDALYHMSNKYPVMVSLEVTPNTTGKSVADPEIVNAKTSFKEEITIDTPVKDVFVIHFPEATMGEELTMECFDSKGVSQMKKVLKVKDTTTEIRCKLDPGAYLVKFSSNHNLVSAINITKE